MKLSYPPRMNPELDLVPFTDGLEEIIPDKITEALGEMDRLEKELLIWKDVLKKLIKRGDIDMPSVYFWMTWAQLQFSDYFIYQKWLIYWLGLYQKLPRENPLPRSDEAMDRLNREMDIKRAKSVPIENFYTDVLRGNGSRLTGRCPFHQERTPSFFIFTNTNTFHCFGACGKHGDVIDYIMLAKDMNFNEALNFLL